MSQGSILGPFLFNVILDDFFLFLKESELKNFAEDNTYVSKRSETIIETLQNESKIDIEWFKNNDRIFNLNKSWSMIISFKKNLSSKLVSKLIAQKLPQHYQSI